MMRYSSPALRVIGCGMLEFYCKTGESNGLLGCDTGSTGD